MNPYPPVTPTGLSIGPPFYTSRAPVTPPTANTGLPVAELLALGIVTMILGVLIVYLLYADRTKGAHQ